MSDSEDAPRALAINVGANTNLPGFRAPVWPDGRFEFVPIPEREPTAEPVPTYGDLAEALGWTTDVSGVADRRVHLDPEFPEAGGEQYTYGDEHAVKAGPIADLRAGDYLLFYATLAPTDPAWWQAREWGAYLVGALELARDPVTGAEYRERFAGASDDPFRTNAHVKRETFDARALVRGAPSGSRLFERAVPLSSRDAGATANRLVARSSDSGAGPWWRRPLGFDPAATADLLEIARGRELERCFEER